MTTDASRSGRARFTGVEIVGAAIISLAAIGLVVSVVIYTSGAEAAFFGLLGAFFLGITGFGVLVAGREARRRRDERAAVARGAIERESPQRPTRRPGL
ncbi:hypothetical protein [Agromyces sp. NPDC058110]|uniref:hypothetical protein n=1 Tax=Agromyces sp. NPDC058110 TaxID=3346345 RepID=UPI0036DAFDB0